MRLGTTNRDSRLRPVISVLMIAALPVFLSAVQRIPISFDDYHGYSGSVKYLKEIAAAYPDITELVETGKSGLGRPIYVLVVTNQKTGTTIDRLVELRHPRNLEVKEPVHLRPYEGKPGQWIDGGTHGNEYTGTEVCLYIIDKLVSGYGSNPEITALVDGKTFYICPTVNPDGVFNSAEREISQRGNGDQGAAKDGPRDLNGDGHITQFRFRDPQGAFVPDDKDPRLMIRLSQGEQTSKSRYSVVTEGQKPLPPGQRGEGASEPIGIDVNRNFPEGWWTADGFPGGSGPYPTSSSEARSLVEFAVDHRNILMVQNFHTSGGFTYRVPGVAPDTVMPARDVAIYDLIMGKKYLELINETVPEAWQKPEQIAEFRDKLRASSKNKYAVERGYEMPRGWMMGYNEERDERYGYGMVIDWWYQQYGAFAMTTELWNPENDIKGFPKTDPKDPDARNERERNLLKYNDEKYGGRLFLPWKPFKHPELGDGEIGGWIPRYRGNALPGAPLLGVCETHWQFELFKAGLLPEIAIPETKAVVVSAADSAKDAVAVRQGDTFTIKNGNARGKFKIVEVTASIENRGKLATQVARGAELRGNRGDVAWLIGDRDKVRFLQGEPCQRLGILEGTLRIPGSPATGASTRGEQRAMMPAARPGAPLGLPQIPAGRRGMGAGAQQIRQTGPRREVKWLVAIEGDSPLKIVVSSEKGGTVVKELSVK